MTHESIALELPHFAEKISSISLSETEKIVALLWFHDHHVAGFEASIGNLAQVAERLTLTAKINLARLKKNIYANPHIARGQCTEHVRIKLSAKNNLNNLYLEFLGTRNPIVSYDLLPKSQISGTGAFFEALGNEINGCFKYAFYDGCATLCRRMTESLLIAAFAHTGHLSRIQNGKDLMMLAEIIGVAKSGQCFRLARGTDKSLDLIKEIGDRAAHHRFHVTSRQDIESVSVKFRAVVSELMNLAGIRPQ